MRNLLIAILVVFAAPTPSFLLQTARADQNPAPTNVGLVNFQSATVGTTAGLILSKNTARAGLIVQNNGTVSVVVKPGSAPASMTDGIVLTAGQIWQPNPPPVDALYGLSGTAGQKVTLIENVK